MDCLHRLGQRAPGAQVSTERADHRGQHGDLFPRGVMPAAGRVPQRGGTDTDGIRHSAKVAWRALAMLQKEIEEEGR